MGHGSMEQRRDKLAGERDERRALARPVVKRSRWPWPLIWVIPLLALLVAGWYFWDAEKQKGPEITIYFADANGVEGGKTKVYFRGVQVGRVTDVSLTKDQNQAAVKVQLKKFAGGMAKRGAMFWVVRPDISESGITGLGTVVSGPYISAVPGTEEAATTFTGMAAAPLTTGAGVTVVVHAPKLEGVQMKAPVYYHGVQVGMVKGVSLAMDATHIDIFVFIEKRFAPLLRTNSEFWLIKGVDVKAGLFSGVKVEMDSLKTLLGGGLGFATPEEGRGKEAETGAEFTLNEEMKKEWEKWNPKIEIGADSGQAGGSGQTKNAKAVLGGKG
ncbi:MAG: MlaD family protein [Phycisphaerae bacterium]